MDIANAWLLNPVGWEEHKNLAQSFKKLNPGIFNQRHYTVVSSFKVRLNITDQIVVISLIFLGSMRIVCPCLHRRSSS